jgi:hypothetical protein
LVETAHIFASFTIYKLSYVAALYTVPIRAIAGLSWCLFTIQANLL